MQLVELGQQPGILVRVVARKAHHRALTPPQLAALAVLGHQPSHALARVAADPRQVAQHYPSVHPAQGSILESPQCLLNPPAVIILALDGQLQLRGPRQKGTDVVQGLNLSVVHVGHHG